MLLVESKSWCQIMVLRVLNTGVKYWYKPLMVSKLKLNIGGEC